MRASQAAKLAREELAALTGLPAETVSSISKKNGTWEVQVDMLELSMVPNTQDVLAIYNVVLDANNNGDLLGYHRVGRYRRHQLEITRE